MTRNAYNWFKANKAILIELRLIDVLFKLQRLRLIFNLEDILSIEHTDLIVKKSPE